MWRQVAATLILIALPSFACAQQQSTIKAALQPAVLSQEDAAAYLDARIAALKAGLKLTPEQEKSWPAVEAAIRDLQKQQIERFNKYRTAVAGDPASARDPITILRRRADMMAEASANLKQFADLAEPFYKSLDDAQKNRLRVLLVGLNSRR